MNPAFSSDTYLIRRKFFAILGAELHVFDPQQRVIAFVKQAAFRLKEDITVYADESRSRQLLSISARSVIDFSAAYDVLDQQEGVVVGTLRRKGLRSLLRDSWEFLDAEERPVGALSEDSMALALLRRHVSNLIPQTFHVESGGRSLVTYKQHFNPFIYKLDVTLERGARDVVDPRLALAAGILLVTIEGRQE